MNTRLSSLLRNAALAGLVAVASTSLFAAFQPAKAIHQSEPRYNFNLRKDSVEGAVIVVLDIDASGGVSKASVIGSSNKLFEEPTLDAVSHWEFRPAMQDGQPVASRALQVVTFNIDDAEIHASTADLLARVRLKPSASRIPNEKIMEAMKAANTTQPLAAVD